MKKYWFVLSTLLLLGGFLACQRANTSSGQSSEATEVYKQLAAKRVELPNGWSLTPPGRSLNLDDLPLTIALSRSRTLMAITNNGQSTQRITLINPATEQVLDTTTVAKAYVGLAFSDDEQRLYASGGNDNKILVYALDNRKLRALDPIPLGKPWPVKISPVGLCLDDARNRLYVVTKEDSALYVVDTKARRVLHRLSLGAAGYTCTLSPDKNELYASVWGGSRVAVINVNTGDAAPTQVATIPTNKNPNDLLLTRDGKYLFVANGNDNTVGLIDVANRRVVETLTASLFPDAPVGTTPNGLALSDDEQTLYIANADNNCLAVFDVTTKGQSRSTGYIPTGWYPTAVKVVGNRLFVTNGKGFTSKANPKGPNPNRSRVPQQIGPNPQANAGQPQYIAGLFKGTLSIIDVPDAGKPEPEVLAAYSRLVYANTPYTKRKETEAEGEAGNPIPRRVGAPSPIKYVFYIIKENRTYDQILGDMKEGNGDAALCLFPEKVTPNQHALAREFVLLDNFYVDAEVSADGHNWSSAAYANDYVEKNWVTSYGGRGGTYDYEGQKEIAHPRDGFLWDHCLRANIPFRTYGWFADDEKPNINAVAGRLCPTFKGYDLSYMDVKREEAWEADFDRLVATNNVPRLSTIRFGNDHTSGARLGAPTPDAAIADNDLAVGRFVEHLSKSAIWNQSVVFILEDDAQNGPDHVDAHRSIAFVAGGLVKRKFVDHTMYSTSGMLRTIELILGLKPMSQYDAAATPMWRCFTNKPNATPFVAREAGIDLNQKNVAVNRNSRRSAEFDFSRPDVINDLVFSEVVWQTVRGERSVMPAPRRGAFVKLAERGDDDDDDD
ncbi:40-residue YVTN family beta-propeller repeat protein [Fibrella aestuarina BUZ 2]|uniref:40-residue YVTN family beta-propeller repeat protein n=1 Tax=Fibrella aestuarina BUZ 2 TaxID=1166018 RepID=I0K803_9BACT|nr:bifunctional YncE family protein/alkaline phosphatase family protein [Fibrella aestuarina]CCH00256.1 40-residue YVTN family beta-propeller repeat protein [Fibrella aestuarina BUZ 2]